MKSVNVGELRLTLRPGRIEACHEDGSPIEIYETDSLYALAWLIVDTGRYDRHKAEELEKLSQLSILKAARDRLVKLDRANNILIRLLRGERMDANEIIRHLEGGAP